MNGERHRTRTTCSVPSVRRQVEAEVGGVRAQRGGERHLPEINADDQPAGVHDITASTPCPRTEHRLSDRPVVGPGAGVGDHAFTNTGVSEIDHFVARLEDVFPTVVADGRGVRIAQCKGPPRGGGARNRLIHALHPPLVRHANIKRRVNAEARVGQEGAVHPRTV